MNRVYLMLRGVEHPFCEFISHLYIFFEEIFIKVFGYLCISFSFVVVDKAFLADFKCCLKRLHSLTNLLFMTLWFYEFCYYSMPVGSARN